MQEMQFQASALKQALNVFFKDALRVAFTNPAQAFVFLRSLVWLKRASKKRDSLKAEGVQVPAIILWSITNECNLHCEGCYNQSFFPGSKEEMDTGEMERIAKEARDLGVSFFVLAGGEPFMKPEILNIIKDYPEIIFMVFTNGLLVNDDLIARFKKQRNVVPLLSLEGYAEETDKRRGAGTYEAIMNTMKKMKKSNIFFGTSLTLTRANFEVLTCEPFIKGLASSGCKFFLFIEYTPTCDGTENWVLMEEQRDRVMDLIRSYRSKYPALFIALPWDEDDVGGCISAGRGFVHINARGDLEPCPFAPFSDVNVTGIPLKEAFKSEFLKRLRQVPELARERGGGCILWQERERVASILQESSDRPAVAGPYT
jgi:MoaA/NifB/PqqE/SkfB family radical SAM enzyme